MSTDFDDNAKLTFISMWSGAFVAIGAAFFAAGIGILYGLLPVFNDARKVGFDNLDLNTVNLVLNHSEGFMYGGLAIVILGIIAGRVSIRNLKLKREGKIPKPKKIHENATNQDNSSTYNDDRYTKTRKQLSYHPENKRFRDWI